MRILLISDSHRYNEIMENVLKNEKYELCIHCGDTSMEVDDPMLEGLYVVKGNHDFVDFPEKIELTIENRHCMICHGHLFHVYGGYEELYKYMQNNDIEICFHGHTHVPHIEVINNKIFINPGSLMFNRGNTMCGSYAIAELTQDSLDVHFYDSSTYKEIPQSIIQSDQDTLDQFKELVKKVRY